MIHYQGGLRMKFKISQIFDHAKENDRLTIDIAGQIQTFIMKNRQILTIDGRHPVFIEQHFTGNWQIIQPDPVVLSANAYLNTINPNNGRWDSGYSEDQIVSAYNDGTKNGQIKERKNLQPLIDAVADLDDKSIHNQLSTVTMGVINEYRKIKPLEENE